MNPKRIFEWASAWVVATVIIAEIGLKALEIAFRHSAKGDAVRKLLLTNIYYALESPIPAQNRRFY